MDSTLSVEIIGLDKLELAFKKAPQLFTTIFDRAVKQSTLTVLGRSRERTPIDKGFLRGPGMQTTFSALTGRIDNVAPYAGYVHDGTIHMKARPFFEWGIDAGQSDVNMFFDQAAKEFANSI